MTNEELIEFCTNKIQFEPENEDVYKAIIKALEQHPSEDCISRNSLLSKLDTCYKDKIRVAPDNMAEGFMQVEKLIKQEPSVTPQPNTGQWIRTRTWEHDGELYCSKCGFAPHDERDCDNFCSNCGAKMEVKE